MKFNETFVERRGDTIVVKCISCEGTGRHFVDLVCKSCKGKGKLELVLSGPKAPFRPCPRCRGTGRLLSEFYCTKCGGHGVDHAA